MELPEELDGVDEVLLGFREVPKLDGAEADRLVDGGKAFGLDVLGTRGKEQEIGFPCFSKPPQALQQDALGEAAEDRVARVSVRAEHLFRFGEKGSGFVEPLDFLQRHGEIEADDRKVMTESASGNLVEMVLGGREYFDRFFVLAEKAEGFAEVLPGDRGAADTC